MRDSQATEESDITNGRDKHERKSPKIMNLLGGKT